MIRPVVRINQEGFTTNQLFFKILYNPMKSEEKCKHTFLTEKGSPLRSSFQLEIESRPAWADPFIPQANPAEWDAITSQRHDPWCHFRWRHNATSDWEMMLSLGHGGAASCNVPTSLEGGPPHPMTGKGHIGNWGRSPSRGSPLSTKIMVRWRKS